jgi:hypothetical protein
MMRSIAAIAFALLLEACSSSYQPARSPRIAVIQEGGAPTLVRDGQSFSVGLFGGGLEDAVQGNPTAEGHASTYKTLTIAGYSCYVAGLGSSIAGLYVLASDKAGDSGNETAGATLALGGVAALITSFVLITNAQPHLWDAVNSYNDGVDASLAYPMPPQPGLFRPPPPPAQSSPPPAPNPAPAAPPTSPIVPPAPGATPPQ